jgi:hypothetical protein
MGSKRDTNSSLDALQEGLRLMRECPLCNKEYDMDQMNVLDEYGGTHLVHITCPHCLNAVLLIVMISEFGMSSVGIVTDLAPKDVERLERLDPIGEDDVLNFHLFLREGKIFEKNIKRYSNLDIRK